MFCAVVNLPKERVDGNSKKVYNVYTKADISRGLALYIYHCGDVSGEVPPVLIPNTEVKLTCAENT